MCVGGGASPVVSLHATVRAPPDPRPGGGLANPCLDAVAESGRDGLVPLVRFAIPGHVHAACHTRTALISPWMVDGLKAAEGDVADAVKHVVVIKRHVALDPAQVAESVAKGR